MKHWVEAGEDQQEPSHTASITLLNLACKTLREDSYSRVARDIRSTYRICKTTGEIRQTKQMKKRLERCKTSVFWGCNGCFCSFTSLVSAFLCKNQLRCTTSQEYLTQVVKSAYHSGCHEEIPRQQRSQPQHEKSTTRHYICHEKENQNKDSSLKNVNTR